MNDQSKNFIFATSSDGHLGVYDIRKSNQSKEKLYALSDKMEGELNCLNFYNNEKFILCGSTEEII
jgi:hypothetical protein